tara:strand:- start:7441 stop:8031 length:591 start_codon:yes stop_codon:yes gene_type:complete
MVSKTIVITGTSRGIGKAIKERLEEEGHTVIGLNRADGFDLKRLYGSLEVGLLKALKEADVFINNVHYEYVQVKLLRSAFSLWQKQNKVIINMSSTTGDKSKDGVLGRKIDPKMFDYQIQKITLDTTAQKLSDLGRCKVVNIRPGWVDTEASKYYKPPLGLTKLKPEVVAETVSYIINQPWEVYIKNISIDSWYKK